MLIKLLSDSTINRIAAGEVIERPASVVKELVENSIDSGSTKINITLERSGKNLIIVSDNGHGMSKEDLEIAVQRHTTSKLNEDDLLQINTFGFRGEALPSIGAISKMTITSRLVGNDKAYQIQVIRGDILPIKQVVHNEGTSIEIRDLFFATPARLKFLRTDKTELTACVDVVKKIALAHPHVSFNLSHDGKSIFKVRKYEGELASAVKNRIAEIVGVTFIENAAIIDLNNSDLSITGYTSIPTLNKASSEDQFLYINNRPVKDKLLNVAVRVAYQDYLARDRHPYVVIFLNITPELVDVNVHPAKNEVRFHDPNLVRNLVINSIKDALSASSHKVSSTIAETALGFFNIKQQSTNAQDPLKLSPHNYFSKPSFNPNKNHISESGANFKYQEPRNIVKTATSGPSLYLETTPQAKVDHETISTALNNFPLGAAKAQLHSTYIISQTNDSIIIVDQHAAHERLGYEKIKETINKNGLIKQRLLVPEIIELSSHFKADLLFDKRSELSKLGLTIEKFGDNSIIVSEIPSLLGDINIKELILDLADYINEIGENIKLTELIEHVTETYACHYSIRAGRVLSNLEMNELLRQMEQTPFSGQCNHGRPTYIELKLKDIEKLFGRT